MIGVQIEGNAAQRSRWLAKNSFVIDHVRWSEIEIERGQYRWPETLDRDQASLAGWQRVLNIKNSPAWARINQAAECSAPKAEFLDEFANFVRGVVDRYHPMAVELWNEPEVSAEAALFAKADHYYGGFGLPLAPHYGALVRQVYRALNGTGVQVIAGALMMPDGNGKFWKLARPNARGSYHALSFHAYTNERTDFGEIQRRVRKLRDGGERSPLWCTETSYLYDREDAVQAGRQAAYAAEVFRSYRRWGLDKVAWYTLANNGWKNSDLVYRDAPKPAWNIYRQYAS